ncbi:MAG: SRPBCC domain-containing protein [Acidimicrobiales bacterium]|nr:SRPBCC domain-containing protein [Acidimicrobiales bacterium]
MRLIREFDAPPEKAFRAHVDPDLFVQWNWIDDYTVTFDHFDCRTGGAYRITMSGPEMAGSVHGSFHDVVPNERIVQTFSPDGMPDLVVLERRTFEDLGDGRTRLTSQSLVESFEYREVFLDAELVQAWTRLDALLATL